MGDRDRSGRTHSRAGLARLPHRHLGPPRPVVIALPRTCWSRPPRWPTRRATRPSTPRLGRPAGRPGTTAGQGHPARRHPGRQPLERAGRAAVRRVRRAPRAADLGVVPAPDAVPGRPSLLHRRRGPGHQPGAAQARGRRRPDPAGRRPHVRNPSQAYTLLDIPVPRQKLVHVHPDSAELARVYRPRWRSIPRPPLSPRRWPA